MVDAAQEERSFLISFTASDRYPRDFSLGIALENLVSFLRLSG
jgi:hypothetical protein